MKIFNGQYFKDHPGHILGTAYTHNPNTGKRLTDTYGKPRTEVWGSMEDVIRGIKVPDVQRFEHFFEATPGTLAQDEKESGKNARIKKAVQKTVNEDKAKADRSYRCSEGLQCLDDTIAKYNREVEYKDAAGKTRHYTISEEEIKVWVTFQAGQGLFNPSLIKNNAWGRYLVSDPDWMAWFKKDLVTFDGRNFIPETLFYSGNIYDKIEALKNNREAIVGKIGEEGFQKQMQKLESIKPTPLLITESEEHKLYLSPFDKIWEQIELTELADGSEVDPQTSIGSIFYFNYLKHLSQKELTIDRKYASAWDIYKYWISKDNFPRGTLATRKAAIKRNTTLIGSILFDRFLIEMLTEQDKARIAYLWNRLSNNYKDVDYHKIPVGFTMGRMFKGGALAIRPAQREGVAFMNHRGTGIVAYDVGVGKTMAAILAISDAFEKGMFKRPLIVVPQKVYKKWIGEIRGVFAEKDIKKGKKVVVKAGTLMAEGILPHIPINDYDNLGVSFIGRAKDKNGVAYTLPEYSITMVTYEGLMKIGFNAETEKGLTRRLKEMLSQGESGRARAIIEQRAEDWIDKAIAQTEIDIEEMGIDAIIVDEAHNFRNLFMEVKGDVGRDGEREKRHFFSGTGSSPSSRALKKFMLNAYIQSKHQNRNTFGLTATPFTNRATEIYSMMAHYDYEGLKDFDVYNLAQFCSKYIDETLESVWTPSGKFEIKAVIRGYNNLPSLQSMIFRSINYKTGEEANIQRPEKVILPVHNDEKGIPLDYEHIVDTKLVPTAEQSKWLLDIRKFAGKDSKKRKESKLSAYYQEDEKGNVPGQILIALNASRTVTFSPYALNLGGAPIYEAEQIDAEKFVNNSPKIKYACECIRSVKQYHEAKKTPISGQVIYSDRGTEWFTFIKAYLVENVGFADKEVAIFHGGVSKGRRERIKEAFLKNEIKVIIGSSTMREGVDLQKYGTVLYNLYLDWNPTDHHQLMGRIWRFGNKFSHVRIVVPLIENSSDVFTWQKLSEKMSRLNSIWTRSGRSKLFEESELNAEELKKGLINDPEELTRWEIEESESALRTELEVARGDLKDLREAQLKKEEFVRLQQELEDIAKEATTNPQNLDWNVKPEQVEKLKDQQITNEKSIYRIVRRYADLKSYWSRNTLRGKIDQHIKYKKRLKKVEDTILKKNKLDLFDDFSPLIDQYRERVTEIESKILEVTSEENFQRILEKVQREKEQELANRRPTEERVNEFKRLNYLLDCHFKIHTCDIYGRAEEIKTGKAIEVVEQPKIKLELNESYKMDATLKKLMPPHQQKVVKEILQGEEGERYIEQVLKPLEKQAKDIPTIGKQAAKELKAITIHAHFFQGGSDWYISEWDKADQLFGYTILNGDQITAEWGSISLKELHQSKIVELDFFWEPKIFGKLFQKEAKPAKKKDPAAELRSAIEGLKIALEFAEEKAQKPLKEAIEGMEVAIEFL